MLDELPTTIHDNFGTLVSQQSSATTQGSSEPKAPSTMRQECRYPRRTRQPPDRLCYPATSGASPLPQAP